MLVVAVCGIPMGGCSLLGIHFPLRAAHHVAIKIAPQPGSGVNQTQAGRDQLATGAPGTAIEAFRRALANGEDVAPAINGLGVAYAMLGRNDLALRYFREAVALDTANTRYQHNLDLAIQDQSSAAEALARREEIAPAPPPPAVAEQSSTGTLERISRDEVRVVTAPPATTPPYSLAKADPGSGRLIVRVASQDESITTSGPGAAPAGSAK